MVRILGIWCVVLSLSFIWPQVWRAVRHDTSHGLSPFGLLHGVVGSTMWLAYGIIQRDVVVWLSNIQFILAQLIIISVVYRHGKIPHIYFWRVAGIVSVLIVGFVTQSAVVVGIAAICISGSSVFPQLFHVLKTDNLHAISLLSYGITIVNCSSWMLYGIVKGDLLISAQNVVTIPIMAFIMFKAWTWRSHNHELVHALGR